MTLRFLGTVVRFVYMRILIIEDEEKIANLLRKNLKAEGFAVDVASDGERGLFLAKTNDYDLVVLDVRLPGRDGIAICRELREYGKTFPVLMLTVVGETPKKVEALNAGADDYLTKPFSFEELLARIRALLRREKIMAGMTLRSGDLELDALVHRVTSGGKPIELTRKEFTLLEYFMRHAGIVLTRGMILEHVWDMDTDPFTNTVEVHVRSLRKKHGKRHCIETVHGYGYKLNDRMQA